MRRMLLNKEALEEMGLKYTIGEFVGNGTGTITVEHALGEVPFLFAFAGNEIGEETSGTFSGMIMNIDAPTRYTSAVTKKWSECGTIMINSETNTAGNASPTSATYGIREINENTIEIQQYASKQYFISGKIYKWIAIADWR